MGTQFRILLYSNRSSDIDAFQKTISEFTYKTNIKSCKFEVCTNDIKFYEHIIKGHNRYDIYFMDYDNSSALAFAKALADIGVNEPVVFISSKPVSESCAYQVRLLDYLFRPIDNAALQKLFMYFYSNFVLSSKILLSKNSNHFYIQLDHIVCLETYNRGVKIYTSDPFELKKLTMQPDLRKDINLSEKSIYYAKKLSEFDDKLEPSIFIQCHQSFMINLYKVVSIRRYNAVLDNSTNTGLIADISKSRYDSVKNSFMCISGQRPNCKILLDSQLSSVAGGQGNPLNELK